MEFTDLKNLDALALRKEILSSKKELFNLKLNLSVGQVKDSSQFKKIRTHIARASMMLAEKTNKTAVNK